MNAERQDQIHFALLLGWLAVFVYGGTFLVRSVTVVPDGPDTGALTRELGITLWFVIATTLAIAIPHLNQIDL